MEKLKIPKNHSGISKTLRLPEDQVNKVQALATLKGLSFNRVIVTLVDFALENLDDSDKDSLNNKVKS